MQTIAQNWQTLLIAWMVFGNAWLLCQLATCKFFSRNDIAQAFGILMLGPFSPVVYLVSYWIFVARRKLRK